MSSTPQSDFEKEFSTASQFFREEDAILDFVKILNRCERKAKPGAGPETTKFRAFFSLYFLIFLRESLNSLSDEELQEILSSETFKNSVV